MRLSILIITIIVSQALLAQEVQYGPIENGKRIGGWPEFFSNNKIKLIKVYGTPTSLRVTDKATAFQLGLTMDSIIDTTIYLENLLYADHYEYEDDWDFIRIRREHFRGDTLYLYGQGSEIGLYDDQVRTIVGRASGKVEIILPLINFSDSNLMLLADNPFENIQLRPSPISLLKNDTTNIIATVEIKPGTYNHAISFKKDGVLIPLRIRSFGYHVVSEDFNQSKPIKIKGDELHYYRTGSEALLNIYDFSKTKLLQTTSLALQKSEIDLTDLRPDKYWIQIIDYSNDQDKWATFILEK